MASLDSSCLHAGSQIIRDHVREFGMSRSFSWHASSMLLEGSEIQFSSQVRFKSPEPWKKSGKNGILMLHVQQSVMAVFQLASCEVLGGAATARRQPYKHDFAECSLGLIKQSRACYTLAAVDSGTSCNKPFWKSSRPVRASIGTVRKIKLELQQLGFWLCRFHGSAG